MHGLNAFLVFPMNVYIYIYSKYELKFTLRHSCLRVYIHIMTYFILWHYLYISIIIIHIIQCNYYNYLTITNHEKIYVLKQNIHTLHS